MIIVCLFSNTEQKPRNGNSVFMGILEVRDTTSSYKPTRTLHKYLYLNIYLKHIIFFLEAAVT